jgi:hypothetical protein
MTKTPPAPAVPFSSDTWSCPFTVCYLNVGRRHLIGSISAVVDLVLKHRPDILFLGDLVASRCHIGKLKKHIERDLKDEWYVTTNTSTLPGRPVGIGAIIHCSLAKYITDCTITPLSHVNKTDWEAAVAGRVLRLQITRPGVPSTWEFIGVYQHVARSANRTARTILRETLGAALTAANKYKNR